ncbi:MAG: phosphodiester glycosidase family protein [Deltaproteobacteria bacterium]|nr:phosphodiester glycosidase family protein [Deltaproteobacteria bacterium]
MNDTTHTSSPFDWSVSSWQDLHVAIERLRFWAPEKQPDRQSFFSRANNAAIVSYRFEPGSLMTELIKIRRVLDLALGADGQGPTMHWIGGRFDLTDAFVRYADDHTMVIPSMDGFEHWGEPYFRLFASRVDRDSTPVEPSLIWSQAVDIGRALDDYFADHDIGLVIAADMMSLPGNVSATLGLVLAAQMRNLPVITVNEAFYWEGDVPVPGLCGQKDWGINRHHREVQALLDRLYPWDHPEWIHVVPTEAQARKLVLHKGINPVNIMVHLPFVDTEQFRSRTAAEIALVRGRLADLFTRNQDTIQDADRFVVASWVHRTPVILGSEAGGSISFSNDDVILLQPTQVAARRRIDRDMQLIEGLVAHESFRWPTPGSTLTLLVTGSVQAGHENEAQDICNAFADLLNRLPKDVRPRVRLAMGFGELSYDDPESDTLTMSEISGAADLVLVPSDHEGRCLPIVEAAAAGIPSVVNQFEPRSILDQFTGKDLAPDRGLLLLSFPKTTDEWSTVVELAASGPERTKLVEHNMAVARNRFSMTALGKTWRNTIERLWFITSTRARVSKLAHDVLEQAKQGVAPTWLTTKSRRYLPGGFPMGYLSSIEGLMVPTGYQGTEQNLAAKLFDFGMKVVAHLPPERADELLLATGELLRQKAPERTMHGDHSFAYRRRNFEARLHDDLTVQQVKGCIGTVSAELGNGTPTGEVAKQARWNLASSLLPELMEHAGSWVKRLRLLCALTPLETTITTSGDEPPKETILEQIEALLNRPLVVDDTGMFLQEVVYRPRTLIHFCGSSSCLPFDLTVLGLHLLEHWRSFAQRTGQTYQVIFVARTNPLVDLATASDIEQLLEQDRFTPLREASAQGLFRVIATDSVSVGINLAEASETLIQVLKRTRDEAILTCSGQDNALGLDIVTMPSFRFGWVTTDLCAQVIGLDVGSPFFQFVPPGVRPTIGFPVPTQDSRSLSRTLHSPRFKALVRLEGSMDRALARIKEQSESSCAPVDRYLTSRIEQKTQPGIFCAEFCGIHLDGYPYTGTVVRLDAAKMPETMRFRLLSSRHRDETVLDMARRFEGETGGRVAAAWNGGYVLNERILAKLGIGREYLGSPLGLVVEQGTIVSPPLFHRPAFTVDKTGHPHIERIALDFAGALRSNNPSAPPIRWKRSRINPPDATDDAVAVYTLAWPHRRLPTDHRAILVLAGNTIMRVVTPDQTQGQPIEMIPVGLYVSIPVYDYYETLSAYYFEGIQVSYDLAWPGPWKAVTDAVEAGPLLLKHGRIAVDLDLEMWTSHQSIATQSGRLDMENLRGPKLGVGLTKQPGEVIVVAVNGRIRDSVGASYAELARFLKQQGAQEAMAFDPGGSSTLVVNGRLYNIPPHSQGSPGQWGPSSPRPVPNAFACVLDGRSKQHGGR